MAVEASKVSRLIDAANSIVLRRAEDGLEGGEGSVLEHPIAIANRFRTTLVEAVVLVQQIGTGDYFLDIVSGAQSWIGDDQLVLVRGTLVNVGQYVFAFDGSEIPEHHTHIACRILMLGSGSALCGYGCFLTSRGRPA